ncbi:MAG: hypothetical protein OXI96_06100 [Acidimicrobiaceae bacterium]|nr:hypothetical protein [Acidimicrobiaceae bacterium]
MNTARIRGLRNFLVAMFALVQVVAACASGGDETELLDNGGIPVETEPTVRTPSEDDTEENNIAGKDEIMAGKKDMDGVDSGVDGVDGSVDNVDDMDGGVDNVDDGVHNTEEVSFSVEEQAVADAWVRVFDLSSEWVDKAAHLEDAESLAKIDDRYRRDQYLQAVNLRVEVNDVTIDGSTAEITYKMLVGGEIFLSSLPGTLELVDSTWTVARSTYCTFIASATFMSTRLFCPTDSDVSTENSEWSA